MVRAAALTIVTMVAGLLAAEPTPANPVDPVGVWRFREAELDRSVDRLQKQLNAEYFPEFFKQYDLNRRQVAYFYRRVESLTPVVRRIFAGTVEFKRNGKVIARHGKGKAQSAGRWKVKYSQVIVTGLELLGDDPFHRRTFYDPPARHTVVDNLIRNNRIELQPPLADMSPALRRASRGFVYPLVRVTAPVATAQSSEADAG